MNCRLLVYLFSRPDQYLTEQEIVRSINPDKPENFYIRKAVCNLKLDKELRSKIFTFQNANTVRLNTTITLQKKLHNKL
ncbi:hypothetical protein JCM19236_6356 [Vibrio sp. JCM 19236]|nr:hypothetical protein JCM19236_6356 [Vibrio sp. JCM 19236]